jgi:hypothetical protein
MLVHFVSDYFHYDGKFWATLKLLLTRPGKLSSMYIEGKHASYLKPVQLYIFISALFFIVFFKVVHLNVTRNVSKSGEEFSARFSLYAPLPQNLSDTAFNRQLEVQRKSRMDLKEGRHKVDSILKVLPSKFSKEYAATLVVKKIINYGFRKQLFTGADIIESIMNTYFHSIPKLFFILMPVLALLLRLFFRKREYLYVDHAVMSLHLHSALFVSFMTGCLLSFMEWDRNTIDYLFFAIVPVAYFFVAFRNFYKTNLFRTLYKGILTMGSYLVIVMLVAVLNQFLLIWFG